MSGLETQLLHALIGLRTPLLTQAMLDITFFGSIIFAGVLGLSIYRFDRLLSSQILVSGVSSYLAAHLIKILVMRPRPPVDILVSTSSYAFPSGHAAVSFGLATVLSRRTDWKIFYAIAGLVCISRVYLGAHYPGDVIAGAMLGYTAGLAVEHITKLQVNDEINII